MVAISSTSSQRVLKPSCLTNIKTGQMLFGKGTSLWQTLRMINRCIYNGGIGLEKDLDIIQNAICHRENTV